MLLTLLMNLNMFGEPPIPPDRLIIDIPSAIETGIIVSGAVTTGATLDSKITTGFILRSNISEEETIDSPITKKI